MDKQTGYNNFNGKSGASAAGRDAQFIPNIGKTIYGAMPKEEEARKDPNAGCKFYCGEQQLVFRKGKADYSATSESNQGQTQG